LTKICILGGSGLIGTSVLSVKNSPFELVYTYRKNKPHNQNFPSISITLPQDFEKLKRFIDLQKPDVIVNTISNSNPNFCENNKKLTYNLHVECTKKIFEFCENNKIKLIHFSTDYVFDGKKEKYSEVDTTNPINYYGQTKVESEQIVLQNPSNVVIRTSLVYGKNDNARFFNFVLDNLRKQTKIYVYDDIYFTPTLVDDIVESVFRISKKSLNGIFHVSGPDCISKYDFALKIADVFKLNKNLILPKSIKESEMKMEIPSKTCLDNSKASTVLDQKFNSLETGIKLTLDQMK